MPVPDPFHLDGRDLDAENDDCAFDGADEEDSFPTRLELPDEPEWAPLEAVARLARQSSDLPSFHECEFMYMAAVTDGPAGTRIHLYKHRDTRRYLNLDDAGHAYDFCGGSQCELGDLGSGGRYRPIASLAEALDAADLGIFERVPSFFRSCPPEAWPRTEAAGDGQ